MVTVLVKRCAVQINKGTDHSVVVYTPIVSDDAGVRGWNFPLPVGKICSDVLPIPGMRCAQLLVCNFLRNATLVYYSQSTQHTDIVY